MITQPEFAVLWLQAEEVVIVPKQGPWQQQQDQPNFETKKQVNESAEKGFRATAGSFALNRIWAVAGITTHCTQV